MNRTPHPVPPRLPVAAALLLTTLAVATPAPAQQTPDAAAQQQQKMMQMYAPELREKVQALSPKTRGDLQKILSVHTRRSNQITFRQVMHEVLADLQTIVAAVATDNSEAAADAARRIANHRLPKGGLFPYIPPDQLTDADLAVLPTMNAAVEGTALKLADAADKGDMSTAASHLSELMVGCVACHQKFRGQPGVSPFLRAPGTAQK